MTPTLYQGQAEPTDRPVLFAIEYMGALLNEVSSTPEEALAEVKRREERYGEEGSRHVVPLFRRLAASSAAPTADLPVAWRHRLTWADGSGVPSMWAYTEDPRTPGDAGSSKNDPLIVKEVQALHAGHAAAQLADPGSILHGKLEATQRAIEHKQGRCGSDCPACSDAPAQLAAVAAPEAREAGGAWVSLETLQEWRKAASYHALIGDCTRAQASLNAAISEATLVHSAAGDRTGFAAPLSEPCALDQGARPVRLQTALSLPRIAELLASVGADPDEPGEWHLTFVRAIEREYGIAPPVAQPGSAK